MSKIYFCSFADTKLKPSLKRIKKEAKNLRIFERIFTYTEKDLSFDERENINTIIKQTKSRRGYGYWAWKPVIILKLLRELQDNDILIYCDAGCELNKNGLAKLYEYIDMAREHDILVSQLVPAHNDLSWTKADTLALFPQIPIEKLSEGQIQGTLLILKNNDYTKKIIQQWKNLMSIKNLHYFDDSPSLKPNNPSFIENRHDQSILSLILKSNHFIAIPISRIYSQEQEGWEKLADEPILQKRNKETFSVKYIIKQIVPRKLWQYLKKYKCSIN